MVYAEYSAPELHSHSAAHIVISLDDEIEVITETAKKLCRGIAIPSRLAHTADTGKNKVLVLLFDHTTVAANRIKTPTVLSNEAVENIANAYYCFENSDKSNLDYSEFITSVSRCTNLSTTENTVTDNRIKSALAYIQQNIHEQFTCRDVANHVFLSEGRFSHLFKQQVGMSFSAYLVSQRIVATYTEIIKGKSITEAAMEAGFSSSAHFAETNKRLFGLSASTITKNLAFYKIADI